MDGAPVRGMSMYVLEHGCSYSQKYSGETIPIRLFLGGFELTPTFRGNRTRDTILKESRPLNFR